MIGPLDGQKFVCMDKLYKAIQNDSCLVYSFGLADDWDFEVTLAHLGKYKISKRFHSLHTNFYIEILMRKVDL